MQKHSTQIDLRKKLRVSGHRFITSSLDKVANSSSGRTESTFRCERISLAQGITGFMPDRRQTTKIDLIPEDVSGNWCCGSSSNVRKCLFRSGLRLSFLKAHTSIPFYIDQLLETRFRGGKNLAGNALPHPLRYT